MKGQCARIRMHPPTHPHTHRLPATIIARALRALLLPRSHHFFSNQELISIAATAKNPTQAWSVVMGSSEPRWLAAHGGNEEAQTWSPRKQARGHRALAAVWGQLFEPPASFPLARSLPPYHRRGDGRERADRSRIGSLPSIISGLYGATGTRTPSSWSTAMN